MPGLSTQLAITRHAVQYMQRHALDSEPEACCGLIGGTDDIIQVAAPTKNQAMDTRIHCLPDRDDIIRIVRQWQQQGLNLYGVYRSCLTTHVTQPNMFANLLTDVQVAMPAACIDPAGLLCLAINLGTDGRLETHAFRLQQGSWQEIALVLEEDGQAKVA